MKIGLKETATIRIHTQAIALFQHRLVIESIYEEMEEVWLNLHTQDKKCPILEQQATNVKRKLVQRYTIELIKRVRRTVGLDLISKIIDPDAAYWVADDIVMRLSDNKTESHRGLFNAILVGVFGLSINVINFIENKETTKNALYQLLRSFYDIKVHDIDSEGLISLEDVTESLSNYLNGTDTPLFEADIF